MEFARRAVESPPYSEWERERAMEIMQDAFEERLTAWWAGENVADIAPPLDP
jgi:hypothetical protein